MQAGEASLRDKNTEGEKKKKPRETWNETVEKKAKQ